MSEVGSESINTLTGATSNKSRDLEKTRHVQYLTNIAQKVTQVIEYTRSEIANEVDYEQICEKLSISKEEINLVMMEESFNIFERQIEIEDYINEQTSLQGKFKGDQDIQTLMVNIVQIFTDWKAEMKTYLAKSPLLQDPLD